MVHKASVLFGIVALFAKNEAVPTARAVTPEAASITCHVAASAAEAAIAVFGNP